MIVTLLDMFHLLLVLLRRADYYWLYDVSVSSLRWEAGSGYSVTRLLGSARCQAEGGYFGSAANLCLGWVTQLGPSLPLMYGECRHLALLAVYTGTL